MQLPMGFQFLFFCSIHAFIHCVYVSLFHLVSFLLIFFLFFAFFGLFMHVPPCEMCVCMCLYVWNVHFVWNHVHHERRQSIVLKAISKRKILTLPGWIKCGGGGGRISPPDSSSGPLSAFERPRPPLIVFSSVPPFEWAFGSCTLNRTSWNSGPTNEQPREPTFCCKFAKPDGRLPVKKTKKKQKTKKINVRKLMFNVEMIESIRFLHFHSHKFTYLVVFVALIVSVRADDCDCVHDYYDCDCDRVRRSSSPMAVGHHPLAIFSPEQSSVLP